MICRPFNYSVGLSYHASFFLFFFWSRFIITTFVKRSCICPPLFWVFPCILYVFCVYYVSTCLLVARVRSSVWYSSSLSCSLFAYLTCICYVCLASIVNIPFFPSSSLSPLNPSHPFSPVLLTNKVTPSYTLFSGFMKFHRLHSQLDSCWSVYTTLLQGK